VNACYELPAKLQVARSFGRAAGTYDLYAKPQREFADRLVESSVKILSGNGRVPGVILDLGSGTGYCSKLLREHYPGSVIINLDIAEAMLMQARKQGDRDKESWLCADAECLPLKADSFDLVVSNLAIQWCPDLSELFGELFRVMKPGGFTIINTLAENTLQELKQSWSSVDGHVHVNEFLTCDAIATTARGLPFASVNVESSHEVYFYSSLSMLTQELKGIGAQNQNRGRSEGLTGRTKLKKLKQEFESRAVPGKGVPVTYDLVTLKLVKPD